MCRRTCLLSLSLPTVLGASLIALLSLGLSGCGSEQRETGTTVEVTDQMLKDAEASDAFFMEQQKQRGKRAGGR